jgi:hypothetical protein
VASKPNPDPTLQDWATAYQPIDNALNNIFEQRITKDNAREVQYNLAVVSGFLCLPCAACRFCRRALLSRPAV